MTASASPMLFGRPTSFNITNYNTVRDGCIYEYNYTYSQLFGKKYWELCALLYNNDASVHYSITGKKRHWLRMQFDRAVEFFDLYEG
tara:strand:+ start:385 stop:645 length:261 start_codon:yes stop_codon:yes gene_type:complete